MRSDTGTAHHGHTKVSGEQCNTATVNRLVLALRKRVKHEEHDNIVKQIEWVGHLHAMLQQPLRTDRRGTLLVNPKVSMLCDAGINKQELICCVVLCPIKAIQMISENASIAFAFAHQSFRTTTNL